MTGFNFNPPNFNQQQAQQLSQAGQQGTQTAANPPAPGSPPQAPAPSPAPQQAPAQGLPQTGLQQQMESLNQMYADVRGAGRGVAGMGRMGYDVRAQQFQQAQLEGGGELDQEGPMGTSSLDSIARNLAQRYGLAIGRGRLVDDEGNFLVMPDQLAAASGGLMTEGEAALKMNFISQALANKRTEQQQRKGIQALQTGLGQVQSRARGSMAALTSGYYQDLADMYANKEYEAYDFSAFIQKEQLEIQQTLQRRAEKLAKKQARSQFITGVGITIASLYTGNVAGVAAGVGMAAGAGAGTGWF